MPGVQTAVVSLPVPVAPGTRLLAATYTVTPPDSSVLLDAIIQFSTDGGQSWETLAGGGGSPGDLVVTVLQNGLTLTPGAQCSHDGRAGLARASVTPNKLAIVTAVAGAG